MTIAKKSYRIQKPWTLDNGISLKTVCQATRVMIVSGAGRSVTIVLPHTPPPPANGRRQKPPSHTGSGRAPAPDPKLGTDPGDLRLRDLITYFKHAPTPPTSPGSMRRWCKHFGQLKVTFQSIVLFCFAKKFLSDCF